MPWSKSSIAAALTLAGSSTLVSAYCPNKCSGHGACASDGSAKCRCFDGYHGADCSLNTCPKGRAWADVATAKDVAHNDDTCSRQGICDLSSGQCTCLENFGGLACERTLCPNGCTSHGVCRSMRSYATTREPGSFDKSAGPHTQGYYSYEAVWDADMIFGCDCDESYTGYDCSLRSCPTGDDPLTFNDPLGDDPLEQLNEKVLIQCSTTTGAFTLTFRGETTAPIPVESTPAEVDAFITTLDTVNDVTVTFSLSNANFCSDSVTQVATIEFTHDFGDLPDLYTQSAGASSCENNGDVPADMAHCGGVVSFYYDGGTVDDSDGATHTSVRGSKENEPCSNRGKCDYEAGTCECYDNFASSDGNGASGTRGDCGFAQTTITTCPSGDDGSACNSKGVCNTLTNVCSCYTGFAGGDCSLRSCKKGRAWFDFPSNNDEAHASIECSNQGTCDATSGECVCRTGWEGSACQYKTCPPSADNPCSGHGNCLSMKLLALEADDNGDATSFTYGKTPNDFGRWDYQSMQGCLCDPGYEGYDCSRIACPTGDDPDTFAETVGVAARHEVQLFRCTADGGAFTLTFRQQTTTSIPFDANAATVKAAIEALESIDEVELSFSSGTDEVCTAIESGNVVAVKYTQQLGDVPMMTSIVTALSHSSGGDYPSVQWTGGGTAVTDTGGVAHSSFVGTMENAECSNRGICSRIEGTCACFTGFASSNGNNEGGTRGDCGWKLPYSIANA